MLTRPASSYTSATADQPLLWRTIGEDLEATVARWGDREALVDCASRRRWTYSELDVEVDELALGLLAGGIGRGDRVGIWSPGCAERVLLQYATAKIGAVLVDVSPAYRTHELVHVVNQSGMRLLVAATRYRSSDYAAMLAQARPDCPQLEEVVFLGEPGSDTADGSPSWRRLLEVGGLTDHRDLVLRMAELSPDDPINIQCTSGTTGPPKAVTLSHHNILNNGYFVGELVGYTEQDRIAVPFQTCSAMVTGHLAATSHGAAIVVPSPTFDPAATLRAVQEERCTSLHGVSTMFVAVLYLPDFEQYDLSSLRTGIIAGSPCPAEVISRVVDEMHMAEVAICYGMTETSPVSTMTRRDDDLGRRTRTVGRTMPHLESKVVDPATGLTVPRGTAGELCTRGHTVMLGYWNQPEKTAEVVDAARWMHTGDLAVIDEDGYVAISGRVEGLPPAH